MEAILILIVTVVTLLAMFEGLRSAHQVVPAGYKFAGYGIKIEFHECKIVRCGWSRVILIDVVQLLNGLIRNETLGFLANASEESLIVSSRQTVTN